MGRAKMLCRGHIKITNHRAFRLRLMHDKHLLVFERNEKLNSLYLWHDKRFYFSVFCENFDFMSNWV
jgi:hypothetical protein